MPNLVKYCVDCFSLLFLCSCRVGYVSGCIKSPSGGWIPQRGCCPLRTIIWYQSIPGSAWGSCVDSRASVAVWRRSCVDLGAALGLFVGSCVDLKQRVDCSRNQVGGVDCFGNSLRVSHGGKDLVFILFILSNSVCFRITLRNQLRRWLKKVHHRENL